MTEQSLQEKLAAARSQVTEQTTKPSEDVLRQSVEHPKPEVIIGDITEDEKAQAMKDHQDKLKAQLKSGYHTKMFGRIGGRRGQIVLTKTPMGFFQSKEDAEKLGTVKNWEYMISKNMAFLKE